MWCCHSASIPKSTLWHHRLKGKTKNKILAKIFQFSRKTMPSLLSNKCTPTESSNQTCGLVIFFCKGCNLAPPETKGCKLSQISKYYNITPNIYLKVYSANSWAELTICKILKDKNSIHQTHHLLYGATCFNPLQGHHGAFFGTKPMNAVYMLGSQLCLQLAQM
jgi:hypothetical protein